MSFVPMSTSCENGNSRNRKNSRVAVGQPDLRAYRAQFPLQTCFAQVYIHHLGHMELDGNVILPSWFVSLRFPKYLSCETCIPH